MTWNAKSLVLEIQQFRILKSFVILAVKFTRRVWIKQQWIQARTWRLCIPRTCFWFFLLTPNPHLILLVFIFIIDKYMQVFLKRLQANRVLRSHRQLANGSACFLMFYSAVLRVSSEKKKPNHYIQLPHGLKYSDLPWL